MPAGRPVSFWFRFELIRRIDNAARAQNQTRSSWVRAVILKALGAPKTK